MSGELTGELCLQSLFFCSRASMTPLRWMWEVMVCHATRVPA